MPKKLCSIRAYLAQLQHSDWRVPLRAENRLIRAVRRLRRSRDRAVDLLLKATRHPDPQTRWRAAYVLADTRQRRALPALQRLAEDPDGEVQYEALPDLGRLGDPRAVPFLVDLVRNAPPDDPRRDRASVALGVLGKVAVPALVDLLRSGSAEARREAALALLDMTGYDPSNEEALRALEQARAGSDEGVRRAVAEAEANPRVFSL